MRYWLLVLIGVLLFQQGPYFVDTIAIDHWFAPVIGTITVGELRQYFFVLPFLCIALGMYGMRHRHLLVYALIELVFGAVMMANAAYLFETSHGILTGGLGVNPANWSPASLAWVQAGAAIYVFVQGLENLRKGLEDLRVATEHNPGPRTVQTQARLPRGAGG